MGVVGDEKGSASGDDVCFIEGDIRWTCAAENVSGEHKRFIGIIPKFEPLIGGGERRAGPHDFTDDRCLSGMHGSRCMEKGERGKKCGTK